MAKKMKKTQAQLDYAKQLKRIKQFIRRAEKRGYSFPANVIPQKPKRTTKASVRKLAKITPEVLYSKAVYGGEATAGEIVSGVQGYKAEKKARAFKAAQTRKANKQAVKDFYSKQPKPKKEKSNKDWTIEDAKRNKANLPTGGSVIFQNVFNDFIVKISQDAPEHYTRKHDPRLEYVRQQSKTTLYSLTMKMVEEVGENEIGWRLSGIPNLDELTQYILFGSAESGIQSATYQIAQAIKGSALSFQELSELAEESEDNEPWTDLI